jgi:hypothetical protein
MRCSDTTVIVQELASTLAKTFANVQIFSGLTESELGFLAQRAVRLSYSGRACSAKVGLREPRKHDQDMG